MAFRTLVHDVEASLPFYVDLLGFTVVEKWGPAFAILERDADTIWLSGPQTSAAQPMPDGRQPEPGGWNRIVVSFEELEPVIVQLKNAGVVFRNDPITGPGGTQVLVEDPSGNPIELFSPR